MKRLAQQPAHHKAHLWLRLGLVLLLLGLALAVLLPPHSRAFVVEAFHALTSHHRHETRAWVAQFGNWGPLALLLAFVVQAVIPFLPALVLVAVSVLAYGPVVGFGVVYLGTVLGACAGYGIGKWVGGPALRALVGRRARASAYVLARRYGLRGVLVVRLMPVLSSEVVSLMAGALRLPFWPFVLYTAAGAVPVTLLVVWLSATPHRLVIGVSSLTVVVLLFLAGRWLWNRLRPARPARRATDPS